MSVNSISPGQPAPAAQAVKKTEEAASRKQSATLDADKVKARREAAEHNVQIQKLQESAKASVNTNGQKVGTLINVSA
jgi:hypothetical protein